MGEKKRAPGAGFGAVSILCVLLVAVLTAFAVLSLAFARADWRLSRKNADFVREFYEADARAETIAAKLAALWPEGAARPETAAVAVSGFADVPVQAASEGEGLLVSFAVPTTSSEQMLFVELYIAPPGEINRMERRAWFMAPAFEPEEADETLPVWPGD